MPSVKSCLPKPESEKISLTCFLKIKLMFLPLNHPTLNVIEKKEIFFKFHMVALLGYIFFQGTFATMSSIRYFENHATYFVQN